MKFAYSSSIFRLRSLLEAVEGIGRAGFCALELVADRPHAFPQDMTAAQITELTAFLEQRKIGVCSLNSCVATALGEPRSPSWLEEDWQRREQRIRYTLDCVRMAAAMGVTRVSTEAGGHIPATMNQSDAWRLFVANLHRVLPLAQKLGVKLLIQPEPELLIESSAQTLALLKELEFHPFLGVDFDAGHFFCVGEDPCEAWEKLRPYVGLVHLEDIPANRAHRHTQLGEGVLDIAGFLHAVEQSGYEGFIAIRLDSYEKQVEETLVASAQYLWEAGFMPGKAEGCPPKG